MIPWQPFSARGDSLGLPDFLRQIILAQIGFHSSNFVSRVDHLLGQGSVTFFSWCLGHVDLHVLVTLETTVQY